MQLSKTAAEGIIKIEKWLEGKSAFFFCSEQKDMSPDGGIVAHFRVYRNKSGVEVVLNRIESTCVVKVNGHIVIPINRSLCEYPETLFALIQEFTNLVTPQK
jgi:hypothetical protein